MTSAERYLSTVLAYEGDNLWEDVLYRGPIVADLDSDRQEGLDPAGAWAICFKDGSTLERLRDAVVAT